MTDRLHAVQADPALGGDVGPGSSGRPETLVKLLNPGSGAVLSGSAALDGRSLLAAAELAAAAVGEVRVERETGGPTGPVRVLAARLPGRDVIAVVAVGLAGCDTAVADLCGELALALPLVLLAAAAGAYLLTAGALRPVERMRARAAAITPEDPDPRLPVPAADDEIARLGATLYTRCWPACTPHWPANGSSPPTPTTNCAPR